MKSLPGGRDGSGQTERRQIHKFIRLLFGSRQTSKQGPQSGLTKGKKKNIVCSIQLRERAVHQRWALISENRLAGRDRQPLVRKTEPPSPGYRGKDGRPVSRGRCGENAAAVRCFLRFLLEEVQHEHQCGRGREDGVVREGARAPNSQFRQLQILEELP